MQRKLLVIISVDFDVTGQLLIIYSARKSGNAVMQCISYLKTSRKPVCDSFRREVLYNIRIGFVIPVKHVSLIKMCLNETYSRVRVGQRLSDVFPIENGSKQGDAF